MNTTGTLINSSSKIVNIQNKRQIGGNQLNNEIKYVQLEKLDDIIKMMSASMRFPPLHHKEVKDGHVYFLPGSLALGKAVIYLVKVKEKVENKYIVLDTLHDKISFSDELSTKPSIIYFTIVEVTSENIMPTDIQ
jgi:hypothetical protein